MAYPYTDLGSVLLNVEFQLEVSPFFAPLSVIIETYRLANPDVMLFPLPPTAINETLKRLTGCVVATGTDLNCYPTGLNTAILFDADGNPVT